MKALLVGAGAVGQVYGRHLQLGGAEVSFFVKEKYRAQAEAGYTLYPLHDGREPVRFEGFGVLTDLEQVRAEAWDQVWLCVSTTALHAPWLQPFLEAIVASPQGSALTLVALQPGFAELDHIEAQGFPRARVVQGLIALISYQAPLEGEDLPQPGVAYWLPPLTKSPFSSPAGDEARVKAVVGALKAGGCPASRVDDAGVQGAFGSSLLMPHLCGLEIEGWSLAALRKSATLRLAGDGSREALGVMGAVHGTKPDFALRAATQSWLMRPLLCAAPKLMPLPLEPYLRYHFTKVGDQTRFMMQRYVDVGRERGLPTENREELLRRLPPLAEVEGPAALAD